MKRPSITSSFLSAACIDFLRLSSKNRRLCLSLPMLEKILLFVMLSQRKLSPPHRTLRQETSSVSILVSWTPRQNSSDVSSGSFQATSKPPTDSTSPHLRSNSRAPNFLGLPANAALRDYDLPIGAGAEIDGAEIDGLLRRCRGSPRMDGRRPPEPVNQRSRPSNL